MAVAPDPLGSPPPPPSEHKRKRVLTRLRLITLLLLMPLLLVFMFFCARWSLLAYYNHKVKAEINLLLADGGSTDPATLVPPHLPGADGTPPHALKLSDFNFSRAYMRSGMYPGINLRDPKVSRVDRTRAAIERFETWRGMREIPVGKGTPRLVVTEWDDDWMPFLEEHLAQNEQALSLLKREAASGSGYFERSWLALPDTQGAEGGQLYLMTYLLQQEAVLKARKGDAAGAMEDVRLILRVRRLTADDPRTLARYYDFRMDYIAFATLKGVLTLCRPGRSSIEAVLQDLDSRDNSAAVAHSLLGDTAAGIKTFDDARRNPDWMAQRGLLGPSFEPFGSLRTFICRFLWLSTADEANYLVTMRQLRQSVQERHASGAPLAGPVQPRLPAPPHLPFSLLSRHMTDIPRYAVQEAPKADARLRVARLALALALYRADTGAYPSALSALVPAYLPVLPSDPSTGRPLSYAPAERGYVISCPIDPSVNAGSRTDAPVWELEEYEPQPKP